MQHLPTIFVTIFNYIIFYYFYITFILHFYFKFYFIIIALLYFIIISYFYVVFTYNVGKLEESMHKSNIRTKKKKKWQKFRERDRGAWQPISIIDYKSQFSGIRSSRR